MAKHKPKRISRLSYIKLNRDNQEKEATNTPDEAVEDYSEELSSRPDFPSTDEKKSHSAHESSEGGLEDEGGQFGYEEKKTAEPVPPPGFGSFHKEPETLRKPHNNGKKDSHELFGHSRLLTHNEEYPEKTSPPPSSLSPLNYLFNSEASQSAGLQRVFRKSILFLFINIVLFSLLAFVGINLFRINPLITLFVYTGFAAVTNIFYIILADKSYVWFSLVGQVLAMLLVHSLVGQAFSLITLFFIVLVSVLSYFAYLELEKFQLGCRLFSVSLITAESTRILTNVAALVVCLGVFNHILYVTPSGFFREVVFGSDLIKDNIIYGRGDLPSLNRFLKIEYSNYVNNQTIASGKNTFYHFLQDNYRPNTLILPANEAEGLTPEEQEEIKRQRAEEWRIEAYGNLPYTLDTELNEETFEKIIEEYYVYPVKNFTESNKQDSGLGLEKYQFIGRELIVPTGIAALVFVFLTVFKVVFNFLTYILTWLIWRVLLFTGYVKMDVETVEAEVVSI
jgi:hypothetical protein